MKRALLCLFLAHAALGQAQPAGVCKLDGSDCSVKTLNSLAGHVTLAAGSNVTITPSGNTLTVASTAGGSGTVTSVGNGTIAADFTASWATATTTPALSLSLASTTGTGAVVRATSPTFVTPTLGAATATSINSTAIPSSKTLVVTTDKLSVLATTSSSEVAGVISDETGSGAAVFGTSPTIATPTITGVIPSYNGITTAGLGVPVVAAVVTLTGQTASIGTTNILASAPAGQYLVYGGMVATTAGTAGTVTCTINWVDPNSTSGTVSATSGTAALGTLNSSVNFNRAAWAAAGSDITYATTVASGGGGSTYDLWIVLVRFN